MKCINCGHVLPEVEKLMVWDTRFGIPNDYQIRECPSCSLEQTLPRPSQSELNNLYYEFYNFSGESNTKYTKLRSLFYTSFLSKIWSALDGDISFYEKVGSGALLDIGCNEGRGLEFYQNNGFHVTGLELNSRAADVARKKGFEVHDCELESFKGDKKFDVIVLSNVLEHSLDPVNTLHIVYDLLKTNGQVWISCPNSNSWLRTLFNKYWINWHVPFHLTHFSPFNLRKMLLDAGFHAVESKQETPALWVSHSIIARFFAKQGSPTRKLRSATLIMPMIAFIRGVLFPLLWLGNRLGRGDCLVIIAHK